MANQLEIVVVEEGEEYPTMHFSLSPGAFSLFLHIRFSRRSGQILQLFTGFPNIVCRSLLCHHRLSVSKNSEIMHGRILMPYCGNFMTNHT